MNIFINLFILGITVSFGPCLVFCSPLILPYIAGTRKGWREGLSAMLVFCFSRLFIYGVLGLLASLLGRFLVVRLKEFSFFLFLAGGLFICVIGLLIIFGKSCFWPQERDKDYSHRLCLSLRNSLIDNRLKGPIILAFVVSLLPCLPVLGVLAYIALKAKGPMQGMLFGLAFGLGKFFSPLIPLGVLASVLTNLLIRNLKIYNLFSRFCGVMLFLLGCKIIISQLIK